MLLYMFGELVPQGSMSTKLSWTFFKMVIMNEKWYVIGWNAFIEWKWKMMDQRINFWYITLVFKKITKSQVNQITCYNVIDFLLIISWKLSSFWWFSSNWRFFDLNLFENMKTETIGY